MIYLDAAYIAKFYLAEPDSARVRQFIISAGNVACSIHGRIEVCAVCHRKLRENAVTQAKFTANLAQFDLDCAAGAWNWLPMTASVIGIAKSRIAALSPTVFLRAADALHLACALENGHSEIYTNDKHLLAAAPHFGLSGVTL
jgi:predicted nucleic acid-binding protein